MGWLKEPHLLDEIASKTMHKEVINRGKRSKTLNEVNPVKNISKNPESFLEIHPLQKEFPTSHKLQDHIYESQNAFGWKKDNPSKKNYQNQLSHTNLSHTQP